MLPAASALCPSEFGFFLFLPFPLVPGAKKTIQQK